MQRFFSLALIVLVADGRYVCSQEKKSAPATRAEGKETVLKEYQSRTEHRIRVNGAELRYTAAAGNLLLKEEDGKVKASVFFVAYTKNTLFSRIRRRSWVRGVQQAALVR
jgi:carboxypeptidase C (cathepsin A)